jgi:hypothetical protein
MNPRTLLSLLISVVLIHACSQTLAANRAVPQVPPSLCAASAGSRLHAVRCDDRLADDGARTRRAFGQRQCWWTVTAVDLDESVDGVGERTARALIALRDSGQEPTPESLRTIPRLGAGAREAVLALDTGCGVRAP